MARTDAWDSRVGKCTAVAFPFAADVGPHVRARLRVRITWHRREYDVHLDSLHALYVEGLQDLYSAEGQIVKALPKLIKAATSEELKSAFASHLEQSKEHIARLERICGELDVNPKSKHCKGMEGLLAEGAELMQEDADPDVMDAGLIASAQHVEHYEMAGYGTVRTYAQLLGFDEQSATLQETLDEEEDTDLLLTELSQTVNVAAMSGDDEQTQSRNL